MRYKAMAMLAAATLALAACGGKTEDNTAAEDTGAYDNSGAMADLNAVDNTDLTAPVSGGQGFANAAAAGDAFQIASSKLALTASSSAAVKKFAQAMITAHTASTQMVKAAAAKASPAITPDPTLSAEQQAKIDALQGKTGAEFDSQYAADQVAVHEATLDALKTYAATGDVPELKAVATELVPTVTAHLNMAKALK